MRKINKGIIGGVVAVLLLVVVLVWALSRLKSEEGYDEIDTIVAIPTNSKLVLHIPKLKPVMENLESGGGIWAELQNFAFFSEVVGEIDHFRDIAEKTEAKQLLKNAQLTIASRIVGKETVEHIYVFPLQQVANKEKVEELITIYTKDQYKQTKRKYSGETIFTLQKQEDATQNYHYSFVQGLFIISTSHLLLEDALLQMKSEVSMLDNPSFQRLKKIASTKDEANLFLNGKQFPKLLALSCNQQFASFVRNFTNFAEQGGFDINIDKDKILVNGFLYTNVNDFHYSNILLDQEGTGITMESVIPTQVVGWASLALSDKGKYLDQYKRYLEQTGEIKNYRQFLTQVKEDTKTDVEKVAYEHLDQEVGVVILGNETVGEKDARYCVLKTKGKSAAEKDFVAFIQKYADKKAIHFSKFHSVYRIDQEVQFDIYEFPYEDFAYELWGSLFFETKTKYATFIDNYLVFGESEKSLKSFIHANVLRKTLQHDNAYQKQKEFWIDDAASFYLYFKPGESQQLLQTFLSEDLAGSISKQTESLRKFSSLGMQIKPSDDMLYCNTYLSYEEEITEKPRTVWQSRLDATFRMKPALVQNHVTKEKEILVQDEAHTLYLIGNTGRILWKNKLEEPIIGAITQVDAYKNGKLQYVFNTPSKLYLLDRNGNNVERFPVKLKATATAEAAVFDYDQNHNYRILVPCDDKKSYMYDIKGNVVVGWKAEKTEKIVTQKAEHFRVGGKDYLVKVDANRMYILNRKGENRATPKETFLVSENNHLWFAPATQKHKDRLVGTDSSGKVYFTYFDGKVETKTLDSFSAQHHFLHVDLDANGEMDYVFVDQKQIVAYNDKGKKIFNYEFEEIASKPFAYSFSAHNKKIGVQAGKKIFLFDKNGKLYKGFPLEGYTPFSIGLVKEGRAEFNLFVGGDDDLLYNYVVK